MLSKYHEDIQLYLEKPTSDNLLGRGGNLHASSCYKNMSPGHSEKAILSAVAWSSYQPARAHKEPLYPTSLDVYKAPFKARSEHPKTPLGIKIYYKGSSKMNMMIINQLLRE